MIKLITLERNRQVKPDKSLMYTVTDQSWTVLAIYAIRAPFHIVAQVKYMATNESEKYLYLISLNDLYIWQL